MQESLTSTAFSTGGKTLGDRLFNWINRKSIAQFKGIPGPTPSFPMGTAPEILGKKPLWEVFGSYAQNYGGMSLIWILSKPSLVLNDPMLIRQVLLTLEQQEKLSGTKASRCPMTQAINFYKDLPRKALRPMLTDTSTFIAKEQNKAWHNLAANNPFMLPYFDEWMSQQLEPLQAFLKERSLSIVEKTASSKIPAYDAIQELTFEGFAFSTIGRSLPLETLSCFREMCKTGTSRMSLSSISNHLIFKKPVTLKYRRASQKWFQHFSKVLEEVQGNPDDRSLLSWVLKKGETNYSDEDLRNYIAGVYPGGAISSPSGTTSALHFLWQHPEHLDPLRQELTELFAAPLTLERLESCKILDQVLRETLRLRPPVPFFTRNVGGDGVKIGNFEIPGKTQLFITNWYTHRNPNYWDHAETFDPNRWDEATCQKNTYGSDYFFPFGRGSRACIGQIFAKVFMKLSLAVLVHGFDFEFGPESDDPEFYFAVSVPRQLKLKLTPR